MIASPDGTVTTTAPGDTPSGGGTATDIGKPVNPASPADVGQ